MPRLSSYSPALAAAKEKSLSASRKRKDGEIVAAGQQVGGSGNNDDAAANNRRSAVGSASTALKQLERDNEAFEKLLEENRKTMQQKLKALDKTTNGSGREGQPMYRQPDGSLGPMKPPKNPYTVAARKQFADLVHYCRITGGDEEYTKTNKSYRYNIGTCSVFFSFGCKDFTQTTNQYGMLAGK